MSAPVQPRFVEPRQGRTHPRRNGALAFRLSAVVATCILIAGTVQAFSH